MMKNLAWPIIFPVVICIGLAVIFFLLANGIATGSVENFDLSVAKFVQNFETSWLTMVFKVFTWIGSGYVVALLTIGLFALLFFSYRAQSVLFISTVAGSMLLNHFLKIHFHRERPEMHRIMEAGGYSFPSGHTMMAFTFYPIIAYIAWRLVDTTSKRVLICLFAALMASVIAMSRIYLGVHFPTDIIGGIVASVFWMTITITLYRLYDNTKKTQHVRR